MKLFIYEKFWDSFLRINKTTQKKITEFISKFKENSASSAINLERINTFKDDSLRTARIDQKYRAVLKEVKPRELYLLVWVDNHDEAMNWAQNKTIDWNENTESFQIYEAEEISREVEPSEKDKETLLFYGQYDEKQLLKIGVPEVLLSSVLEIQDLNQLEKIENYLPRETFENLFYLMDGANIDALITEIKEGTSDSEDLEEQMKSKNNVRSFIELTDDEIFNEALQGSLQKWKYYLHPSQAELVNKDFRESVKISGGAGTGKTVAALHRLRYLTANKRSELPILFTTFTKELTENLSRMAASLIDDRTAYSVQNIDSLAFQLAREFGLIQSDDKVFGLNTRYDTIDLWEEMLETRLSEFDEKFLEKEYEQVFLEQDIKTEKEYFRASRVGRGKPIGRRMRHKIWKLTEAFKELKAGRNLLYKGEIYNLVSNHLLLNKKTIFSHIIVDELQDFSNIELRFIRSLITVGKNDLFLVGDPLQNIYNKRINFSKLGINIRGRRSHRLRINYRTTEEIKDMALKVIREEDFDDFDGGIEDKSGYVSLFHGTKPEYVICANKTEELKIVQKKVETLLELGYKHSDIAVAARTRDTVKDFRNYFHQQNILYVTKKFLDSGNEGVRLTTFHGMKGLEFKHVFLVNVNEHTLPLKPYNFNGWEEEEQDAYIKAEKSLFYVACSRAVESLVITGIGRKSELLN